ncbi:MAG: NUDIX domain-containing protein [bacterium]
MRNRSAAIIIQNDKILLIHRLKEGREYYVFPGGGIENSETPEQTAVREVKEETSVDIKLEKLLYRHFYDNGETQYYYLASYISGNPRMNSDTNEARKMKEDPTALYEPKWYELKDISQMILYPLEIRDWLIDDLKTGFSGTPREATIKISELRRNKL